MASCWPPCNFHALAIRDNCLSLRQEDITQCDHEVAAGFAHNIGTASCHVAQARCAHWAGRDC